jgi:hypothetical protein
LGIRGNLACIGICDCRVAALNKMEQNDYSRQTDPIYFNALLPYIIALAIGALFIGLGTKLEIDGLRYAGTVLDLLCGILAIMEIIAISHKHITAINSERKTIGLPLIGKDALLVAQPNTELVDNPSTQVPVLEDAPTSDVVLTQDSKSSNATFLTVDVDEKPPVEFLQWLWTNGGSRELQTGMRQVRGEEWMETNTQFVRAGEWLRILARHRFIRGRNKEERKPGCLVGTVEECIKAFHPSQVSLPKPSESSVRSAP